ncbi:MAG: glycosyltransferase [bacterium]
MITEPKSKESAQDAGVERASTKAGAVELSVIIVNYNVKEFLEQTLISVQRALKGIRAEIIVVDNASRDGSVALIQRRFPGVELLVNSENLGFGRASNQGLARAQGQYIALLNPDTIVQEDTFASMMAFFKAHPDTGMLGCKILNPDGTLQLACRRSSPTPWVAFAKIIGLSRLFPNSRIFGRYNLTYLDPDQSYEVDAISGSFMMIQRRILQVVGSFDEAFFLYGEDLDWCFRIRQSGWKVRYFPGTKIIHFKGESSKRSQFDSLRLFYQAMALFAKKHFKHKYLLLPYWVLLGAIWFRAGFTFLKEILLSVVVPLTDFLLISFALVAAIYWRFGSLSHLGSFIPVDVVYSLIWIASLTLFGCYARNKLSAFMASAAVVLGFLVNASLTYFFNQYAYSRAVVLLAGFLSLLTLPTWRLMVKILPLMGLVHFPKSFGKQFFSRKAVIVGDFEAGEKLLEKISKQEDGGYKIVGLVSVNGRDTGAAYHDMKVLGSLEQLNDIIQEEKIQEVIFSAQRLSYDRILGIISRSGDLNVNFKLVPSNLEVIIGKASIDRIDDFPLLEIDYKLHKGTYKHFKRLFDFSVALLALVLTLPIFLFKLLFTPAKLSRRMVGDGENGEIVLLELSGNGSQHLNKIPYLWSVLKGDLSLVGSEITEFTKAEGGEVPKPVDLKPGLTGLVQLNAGRNLSQEDKEKYNLYYLKNYSPLLDVEILLKSLFNK